MEFAGERKFTGIIHDLGSRALEDDLRARESQWRTLVDAAVGGIVLIDARGPVEAFNLAAERLSGFSKPSGSARRSRPSCRRLTGTA